MPADLPSVEEALKDLVKVKASIDVIVGKLSRKPDAVIIKCKRLGFLVDDDQKKKNLCSSSTTAQLVLPGELPSVEEALKLLAAISGLSGAVLGIFVEPKA